MLNGVQIIYSQNQISLIVLLLSKWVVMDLWRFVLVCLFVIIILAGRGTGAGLMCFICFVVDVVVLFYIYNFIWHLTAGALCRY